MSALNAALCTRGIILWLAVLLASRSTHSAPVYDQDTTQVAEYDGAVPGCYFNYQRYQEGDRIITSEPCLNCTCHNRMLMCYLKVCPFTKAIGQDCTVEKRPDQCCPVITCPEVPVQLLTSTTSIPSTSDSTEVGFHDNYGCNVDERFYADGAQLPVDHHNPCELCYCIRNRTTCVMQECTLQVAGCKPVYQPGVCCPIRYNCEYDEEPSTTVGTTPGLIMTTTLPPGVLPQCYHKGKVYEDGELIYSTQPCQHCYCFRGEIACAVQNCGTPMQAHGKNCTAMPPPEGECCPTTYQCEEDGQSGIITLPEGEEQLPEQIPHELPMTESPMLIDQEQQVKSEHPQEESFPGADNAIPHHEEGEGVQGVIEHVTEGHLPPVEKPEEETATLQVDENAVPEKETTPAERETTLSHEHITEASVTEKVPEEAITVELPAETSKPEMPTTVQETEGLGSEEPAIELPETSSVAEGLPEEEAVTTERTPEEHVSTEKSVVEHSTLPTVEKEEPTESSVGHEMQTESATKSRPEEATETERSTEEGQISVTEISRIPEISTESEQPGITIAPESATELPKEIQNRVQPIETSSIETIATETELPAEEATSIVVHEISSTEQTSTQKEEIIHPTEAVVTELAQSTEVTGLKEQPAEEEQKPEVAEGEEEHKSEIPIPEHATVGSKKEDAGLTEIPAISGEPITEEEHIDESTPEIPPQGPTGISIPARMPEQKAEDEYHVTEDYSDVTKIVSPDNLVTEAPQKIPTLAPSEETAKPIPEETTVTEIITSPKETKTESTSAVTQEPSVTTIAHEEHIPIKTEKPSVPEEIETEIPQIHSTEQAPTGEELPTKGPIEESGESPSKEVGGLGEKESQPKKEQSSEEEIQPSLVTEPETVPETSSIPAEYEPSTVSGLEEEEATKGEQITTGIPSVEQSTQMPEIETAPVEEEKPVITEKPAEEHTTKESIVTTSITSEEEKDLQTEKPASEAGQTTETIKEKPTTEESTVEEEKTEQYPTQTPEETAKEPESTEGISTESVEQQTETAIIEKEPSEEITEPTEVPVTTHSTEKVEVGEEKISGSTESSVVQTETEKMQTETSVSEEHLPTQPSITDRKEDQEPIEQKPSEEEHEGEEQITQKPSFEEKGVTEIYTESTVPSEAEGTHIPSSEEAVTESALPEGKPTESTTESATTGETVTQSTPKEEPEEAATESIEKGEQTHKPVTEESEIHVRKETETPSPVIEGMGVSETTEVTISESTTKSVLISEISTELPVLSEEHTEQESEISTEKEMTKPTPSEEGQEPHERTTQPSIMEEKPSQEAGEVESVPVEISTEEAVTSETSKVPVTEEQKPEGEEISTESTKTPVHEEKYSTVAPTEEIPDKITTEIPQYSTEYPTSIAEQTSIKEESTSEIVPRPSGIPGEGNCLVEGQSYNNNSAVPPANVCQTSCRCISSIIQCELVQCPAPPEHLSNCMPVHTTLDACCPMYACDSIPTDELESDSHKIEPHIPEVEEGQKTVAPSEISTEKTTEVTEVVKESSTVASEISTPESQPTEVTVSQTEEEVATEKQQTTTVRQPVEHPEEHTITTVPETSEEYASQVPEEEHTEPQKTSGDITEGEGLIRMATSTEQPQEHTLAEQTPHGAEEESTTSSHKEEEITVPTVTEEKETSVPVEVEKVSTPKEKEEEITTIAAGKEEETTMSTKEQEKPTEGEGIEEQYTLKPIEETEKKQPEKEEAQPTSEEPISSTVEEHETSTIPEISEGEKTVKPTESTSIPEIQSTTAHEEEIKHETVKEEETTTSTEGEQVSQTAGPEIQTKLPLVPSDTETQEPVVSVTESTTVVHDQTVTEEAPFEEHATIKSVEKTTEESKEEIETRISTEIPVTEEEHVTISTSSETPSDVTTEQEVQKTDEEISKATESISEVSHEETSPEPVRPTEGLAEIETTEHAEEHTKPFTETVTEIEEEPSITKLSEEKPSEPVSPEIGTEQPAKTTEEGEAGPEKPTEPSITHEPESTQVSIEEHPEVTPEIESHTTELPTEEHTKEVSTISIPLEEEASEQPVTPIVKETPKPSISEAETEQPLPEAPSEGEGLVTVAITEQTPTTEEHLVEEHTTTSVIPSEGETSPSSMAEVTPESITRQEEHVTEKTIESAKPETETPGLTEEHTVVPEIVKEVEEEEQKPEVTIKEEPVTKVEATTEEEVVTHAGTTEVHPLPEEHTEEAITPSEIEIGVKVQAPVELEPTILPHEESEEATSEAGLPEHPIREESTTTASLTPEEHPTATVETEEKEEPQQTTLSILEEEPKLTTETAEVEISEGESVTVESATQEPVTKVSVEVSSVEQPEEVAPTTPERPELEQEAKLPEEQQGETTIKTIEGVPTEEKVTEEIPSMVSEEEKETHSTEPTLPIETTSIHEEGQPPIIKLQPTEGPLPSEEETLAPEEIHPSQPEEDEEAHPSLTEEPQSTEHAPEGPIAVEPEEHPEIEHTSEAVVPEEQYPIKVSGSVPAELPEEKVTLKPTSSEEPIIPEEGPQSMETPIEEHVTKIQPITTESPTAEEIPEESEEEAHPHIDHFPEATAKPEIDYSTEGELTLGSDEEHLRPVNHTDMTERPYQPSFHEQQPVTTSASHIPEEYPDQSVSGEDNPHFPMHGGGYLNPDEEDYDEDDQAIYGPGTCRYGGKVYVSAQQIPRDDPCDFCFCFRSDIICLQQSCPPPIPGCHEEPISGFCCPRYECPVSMGTALNLTTTTTTTTTTLPPHFHSHAYKGAAIRTGCQISGQIYRVGEVIKSASGPCLHCTCGGDGNMKCDPRTCTPEPMLRQMIAAATAKRRR